MAGFSAGALGAVVGNPADLTLIRMQVSKITLFHRSAYQSTASACKLAILILEFFHSTSSTLLRFHSRKIDDASAYFGPGGGSDFESYPFPSSRLGDDGACYMPVFSSAAYSERSERRCSDTPYDIGSFYFIGI